MQKDALLENILDLEWDMFVRVKSAHPVSCQRSPDRFRTIRKSVFGMWTEDMLSAYLEQLRAAKAQGRNLLTEKYARMDELIPPLTENPLIGTIIKINEKWQRTLQQQYPALFERCCRGTDPTGDGHNFSVYLCSELETYGDRVIELYYLNVQSAEEQKRNLSEEALLRLVQASGYRDLEQAETALSEKCQGETWLRT